MTRLARCQAAYLTYLKTILLALCVVASVYPTLSQALTFTDDFNRPDSKTVGNGWSDTAGNSGGNLEILNNELTCTAPIGSPGAGIFRPFSFTAPTTVTATVKELGRFGRRYNAEFWVLNNGVGVESDGYGVVFSRSDAFFNNSLVSLFDGLTLVDSASPTFQYGPVINVSITFNLDGSVTGTVSEPAPSTNSFPFTFGPHTIQSTGSNFSISTGCAGAGDPLFPRFDDVTITNLPTSKRPVVIIPGIMGTELHRADNNDLVWLDTLSLVVELNDSFLFPLLLKEDGAMPDANSRCAASKQICTTNFDCVFPDFCAGGGTTISPNGPLNISVYTAYNGLANFLRGNGYTGGTNLFTVGYDWRLDLAGEAQKFHKYLDEHFPNATDRVDIIAHSMGGLLIRAYLQLYPDDQRITNVIYLGTPQRGAPLSYAKLTGAASFLSKHINGKLTGLNLNTETFLMRNFPTAYALLPRDKFVLINSSNGIAFESLKTSFERLSNHTLVDKANDLHTSGLAGPDRIPRSFGINGTQHRTLEGLNYTDPSCPKGFSDPTGDGTVPSLSSGGFWDPSAYLYVNEEHKNLPGNVAVQQQILNILNGDNIQDPRLSSTLIPDSDAWSWFSCSPIRTHITDEAGHINGLDSEGNLHEEIEDSSHFQFPKNEGGFFPFEKTYAVTIEAIDNGLFTLGFDHVAPPNDDTIGSTRYAGIPVSIKSHAQLTLSPTDTAPDLELDVDGDGGIDFIIPANAPPAATIFPAVLTNVVQNFGLPSGISQSLLAKLAAATAAINRGDTNAARGKLNAFLNEVLAQRGKALTVAQADTLTTLAKAALRVL